MPAKIKKKITIRKDYKKAKTEFGKRASKQLKSLVVESIQSGRSPVEGGGKNPASTSGKARFKEYSEGYAKKKGKKSPVNMTVTGKMLKSIKTKLKKSGGFSMWFSSGIAKYHDKMGAGKSKVIRRLLPRDGENFSRSITKKMNEILKQSLKKYMK